MIGSGAFTNAMVASQAKGRPGICFGDFHAIDVNPIQSGRLHRGRVPGGRPHGDLPGF